MQTHKKAAGSPKGHGKGKCPECGAAIQKHDLGGRISEDLLEAHAAELLEAALKEDEGKKDEGDGKGGDGLEAKIAVLMKKGMPRKMAEAIAKKQMAKKGDGGGDGKKSKPPWVKEGALPGLAPSDPPG